MLHTDVTAFVFCFFAGGGRFGARAVRLSVLRSVDSGLDRFFDLAVFGGIATRYKGNVGRDEWRKRREEAEVKMVDVGENQGLLRLT